MSVKPVLGVGAAPARRDPGRPKGSGVPTATKPGKRIRRSTEDVEATAAKFLAYVKANDGMRIE